jgi:hypothetical protein
MTVNREAAEDPHPDWNFSPAFDATGGAPSSSDVSAPVGGPCTCNTGRAKLEFTLGIEATGDQHAAELHLAAAARLLSDLIASRTRKPLTGTPRSQHTLPGVIVEDDDMRRRAALPPGRSNPRGHNGLASAQPPASRVPRGRPNRQERRFRSSLLGKTLASILLGTIFSFATYSGVRHFEGGENSIVQDVGEDFNPTNWGWWPDKDS